MHTTNTPTKYSEIKGWATIFFMVSTVVTASFTAFKNDPIFLLYASGLLLVTASLIRGVGVAVGAIIAGTALAYALYVLIEPMFVGDIPIKFPMYVAAGLASLYVIVPDDYEED